MKRHITIEIDAEAETCGSYCEHGFDASIKPGSRLRVSLG